MAKIMLLSPKDNNFYNFRSELILRLKELGHEVVLNCPYGKKIDYFTDRGCKFIDIKMDRRGKNVFNDFKLILEYNRLLKKEKPDIVLTYTGKPSIYAGMVCGFRKIPYIINNAGLMETKGLFDIFMKMLYILGFRKASCIMFQNTQERDVITGLLKKVHYRDIPGSGVNLKEFCFSEYPKENEVLTFNFVARIVKIKGIEEFLEAATIIKKKYENVRFVIYGDYDDDEYKRKISELELLGVIEYGGVLLDMKPAIKASHAVVHPSYYEGMTNVVLEHSAMGRPSIGSNVAGVKEGIDDGKTGFIFEVRNVDSLVEAVQKFIETPYVQKKEMGIAARTKMENEFSREIITRIYLEEIDKVLGNKRDV